jgi:hypothetical protein
MGDVGCGATEHPANCLRHDRQTAGTIVASASRSLYILIAATATSRGMMRHIATKGLDINLRCLMEVARALAVVSYPVTERRNSARRVENRLDSARRNNKLGSSCRSDFTAFRPPNTIGQAPQDD